MPQTPAQHSLSSPNSNPDSLTDAHQEELLTLLSQGDTLQTACQAMKVPVPAFVHSVEHSPTFARRLTELRQFMTHNVISALYAAAMKGSTPAQTLWLKTFPPPKHAENTDENNPWDSHERNNLRDWLALQKQPPTPAETPFPNGDHTSQESHNA